MSSRVSLWRRAALFTFASGALLLGCGGDTTAPPSIPAAPSGLQATATFGQVDLAWTDNSGDETGFEVWSSSSGTGGTFALEASVATGVTSYGSTGLQGGTEYCYEVRAKGADGEHSSFTAPTCATTPVPQAPPPTAPTSLAALASSSTSIALTWDDNSSDEQGFEVWRSTTGATGIYSLLTTVAADATTANDSGLTASTEYCYQVRATAAGTAPPSAFTANACGTTPAPPPPGTPSDLVAAATSTTAVGLTWTDNSSNETGFEIWRSTTGPTGTFTLRTTTAAEATSASDGSLTAGTEYCYQIRAIGAGIPQSAFSNTSCATPPAQLTSPSDVSASATSTTAITLTWTDNSSNESEFEVWRSTTGASGTYTLLTTVPANTTTTDNTSLTPGNQYCYKVKAIGAGIVPSSPFSGSSCATTPTPVATPSGLSATATSTTAIDLSWNDNSSNETGFEVWRSTNGASGTYSLLTAVAANTTTTDDTGLTPGTQYCYKVKALGGGIIPSSPLSGSDCATTGAQVTAPSNLAASATSSTAIALSWNDNSSNESGFEIWRSTTGANGTYTLLKTAAAGAESANDTGLTAGNQYCYEVRALGGGVNTASDFSSSDCAIPPVSVRIVLFGDSNTDRCEEDWITMPPSPSRKSSYVSVSPRLGPSAAHLSCMTAGKVEADWQAIRPSNPIKAVNHAIASTTTGGNTHVTGDPDRSSAGSPNARFSVGGTTRFEAEVLGQGYPWSGGEPTNSNFPTGAISRVNAFTPGANDFVYVSMGTNDDAGVTRTLTAAQTEANLRWMAQKWIDAGRAPDHFMITTLAPRDDANSATSISDRNTRIRDLASDLGLHLIDLSSHVSDDNGATWRSASLNIGDGIHYTETVRGWLADQIVSWMDDKTP